MSEIPNVTPDDRHGGTVRCFYCQSAVGTPHAADCVRVQKRVRVRMIAEYEVSVPAHWEKRNVEFQRNEGSWCADNAIAELEALALAHGCLCGTDFHFEFIEDVPGPLRES